MLCLTKKITIITGSYPPDCCGVGDYTQKLYETLLTNDIEVELYVKSNWKISNLNQYFRELIFKKSDIYHMQYPTEGYGYSFLPLFLVVFLRMTGNTIIITVHELSSRNLMAYIFTQCQVFFANKVIVSNSLELKHARRFILKSKKVFLIPIASNIKKSVFPEKEFENRKVDLAYFGHIRPIKGIEAFIDAVSILNKNVTVKIIGQSLEKYKDFYEKIIPVAKMHKIDLIIDKSEGEVADLLSNVKIIYLPFPDGISARRGTLLASLENGCTVISKKSNIEEFNDFFDKYVYLVDSVEQAVNVIEKLLKGELKPKDLTSVKNIFSWENVALEHLKIYNN